MIQNSNKIISLDQLANKLNDIRKSKSSIVLCHGVFDLLHLGHIKYFQEAKTMGDILIVTLTPDKFVNKGPGRPFFNEIMRAESIEALECVDYVSINKWPTAVETITLLKPDLYVKGPDYTDYEQDITGNIRLEENSVKSVGGKIAFTSDITFSSSNLINRYFSSLNEEQTTYLAFIKRKFTAEMISKYISSLSNLKVLIVGEVIIDEYVFCNTIGKSGKEPVLVNQKLGSQKYAGGVLAVANNISDFCDEIKIISYLGDRDDHKKFINQNLSSNIDFEFVVKKNSPTILKTRFIDKYSKTKIAAIYDINDDFLNEPEETEFYAKLEDCCGKFDLVITVDYGHGLITPRIVELLQEKSKYLAVNTQLNSFNNEYHTISKYNKVNYVCVHEGELRHNYRNRTDTIEHLIENLSRNIKSDTIVITRGENGSLGYNHTFTTCPAFATKVVDRIGAGDILLAITSLCLAANIPIDLVLLLGNISAAQMVASIGTGMKLNKVDFLKSILTLIK